MIIVLLDNAKETHDGKMCPLIRLYSMIFMEIAMSTFKKLYSINKIMFDQNCPTFGEITQWVKACTVSLVA